MGVGAGTSLQRKGWRSKEEVSAGGGGAATVDSPVKEEAVSALVMLGFSPAPSAKVVDQVMKDNPGIEVQQAVKLALKMIK